MTEWLSNGEIWGGVFAIPVTPFLPAGEIDFESLETQIEFCVTSGVHGIVYPAVVSEFFTLMPDERMNATAAAIKFVDDRVPFVAGVSGVSASEAMALAEHAHESGANGVMAMLPYVQHFFRPDVEYAVAHYRSIASAAGDLPIILQNPRIGHLVEIANLGQLLDAVPQVRYVKQETSPYTHGITMALEAGGERLDGVFGGLGGVHLLNELDRGACGTMPAPPFVDALVNAFEQYEQGDRSQARRIVSSLAPLFNLELLYNVALIKEVLRRRGIIRHTTCRVPIPTLDRFDLTEVDELMSLADL